MQLINTYKQATSQIVAADGGSSFRKLEGSEEKATIWDASYKQKNEAMFE